MKKKRKNKKVRYLGNICGVSLWGSNNGLADDDVQFERFWTFMDILLQTQYMTSMKRPKTNKDKFKIVRKPGYRYSLEVNKKK